MNARLEIFTVGLGHTVHDLDPVEPVSIGRNHGNVVVLRDEHASRFHAQLYFEDGRWLILDRDTRNGTQVSGKRIQAPTALVDGQEILIGTTRLRFMLEGPQAPATAALLPQVAAEPDTSFSLAPTSLQPDDLTALYGFMAGSKDETDPRMLVRRALQAAQNQTAASIAGFLSLDPDDPLPKTVLPETACVDFHLSRRLTQSVQQDGRAIWLQRGAAEAGEGDSLLPFTDALCIPLRSTARALGALHLYKVTERFTERNLRFCEILAGHLATSLDLLRARRSLEAENSRLRRRSPASEEIIGESPPIQELRRLINRAASRNTSVLITGESGVGKELVALALHRRSARGDGPLVVVNCAAIAPTLLETELFGHRKGSFTDATSDRLGLFQQADEGTLFLDEVGELSPDCQAKLLRAIEGKGFRPVGACAEVTSDVRIIAATNRDLEVEVQEGRFRADLYFRLRVIQLDVPPLRERGLDIPALTCHFLERLSPESRNPVRLSDAAMKQLLDFHWPGNVRQLWCVLESAVALNESGLLEPADLGLPRTCPRGTLPTLRLSELEKCAVRESLRQTDGNITQAARLLGVVRDTLASMMKRHGIERKDFNGRSG